jgi:glycosyltransferase involved in cell wall biosynthesis
VATDSIVTVTIPSYNYVQYLRECVESAATQQGVDVDVVIVENASTDGSRDLARSLVDEYANVRIVEHQDNHGIIASLDRCRDEVRGAYTVLLCADDCLTPGSLARSVEFMDAHPHVGLSYGPVIDFEGIDDALPTNLEVASRPPIIYPGREWIGQCCKSGAVRIYTPEALMRTSTLAAAGRLNPACPKTSDWNMWLRMAAYADIAYLPGPPLAMFRRHERNDSAQYTILEDLEQRWQAFSLFFDVVADRAERSVWESSARRALASQARALSTRAWMISDRDAVQARQADGLLEFAAALYPDESRVDQYSARLWRKLGARWTRTLLVPKRAVNRVQRDAELKRIRRLGV